MGGRPPNSRILVTSDFHKIGTRRYSCPYLLYPEPHAPLHRLLVRGNSGGGVDGRGHASEEELELLLAVDVMRVSQMSNNSAVYDGGL